MIASVDTSGLRRQLSDLAAAIVNNTAQAVDAAVKAGVESARSTTLFKDKTGELRGSIAGSRIRFSGRIAAGVKRAVFIENGTRPHVIRARNGRTLSFVVNGSRRFAASVNHPGTAPRPFMYQARLVAEKTLSYGLEYLTSHAIQKFNSA